MIWEYSKNTKATEVVRSQLCISAQNGIAKGNTHFLHLLFYRGLRHRTLLGSIPTDLRPYKNHHKPQGLMVTFVASPRGIEPLLPG